MAEASKPGRPAFMPTPDQRIEAQAIVACGVSEEGACLYFHISNKTYRKAFKDEIANGRQFIHAALVARLLQKALRGESGPLFFVLERQFGWSNRTQHQLGGMDGKALNFGNLPNDQLAQVLAALAASLDVEPGAPGGQQAYISSDKAEDDSMDTISE